MATAKSQTAVGGLNLYDILYLPFEAAANAQANLTDKTLDFIRRFALDGSGGLLTTTITAGGTIDSSSALITNASGRLITDASNLQALGFAQPDGRPYVATSATSGLMTIAAHNSPPGATGLYFYQTQKSLTIPMISLFNIPALNMRAVTVDLAVEINQVTKNDASKSLSGSTGYDNKNSAWGKIGGSFDVKASAASQDTQSGSNTQKVKYQVHMEAANDPPVGLLRLLDWSMGIDNPPAADVSRMKSGDLFKPPPPLADLNLSK
jgi:hypothetical protein